MKFINYKLGYYEAFDAILHVFEVIEKNRPFEIDSNSIYNSLNRSMYDAEKSLYKNDMIHMDDYRAAFFKMYNELQLSVEICENNIDMIKMQLIRSKLVKEVA